MDIDSIRLVKELYDEINCRAPKLSARTIKRLGGNIRGTQMQCYFIRAVAEENWSVYKGAFNEVVLRHEPDDYSPDNFFNALERYQITLVPYGGSSGGSCSGK